MRKIAAGTKLVLPAWAALLVISSLGMNASARPETIPAPAEYHIRILQMSPPRLGVTATVAINGSALNMDTTRPGDVPEVGERGWPALIRNLRVSDESGRPIEIASESTAGWQLRQTCSGRLTLEYEVDYSVPAAHGWPAMRETAFADPEHFAFIGRSLFVTTPEVHGSTVSFSLPAPWRAVTPWAASEAAEGAFAVASAQDLTANLIVLTRARPDVVTTGGFQVFVTPMGHWRAAAPEVATVLRGVMPRFVAMMDFRGSASYSVVLLPLAEFGGESFRDSFALTVDAPPSRANRAVWGRIIAHEIFHYWNGSRLRGADYANSQWFQEGFTDYAADLAMAASGLTGPDDFRERLAVNVRNYEKLTTPLDAPGSHKGPPLYSGGALVAFCWDVRIRHATENRRNLGDFLRALWRQTNGGQREYGWDDIRAALAGIAALDWDSFYMACIHRSEKLPLTEAFALAGLRSVRSADGAARVEPDPLASPAAKALWRGLVEGR